ncbi:hypothetical protein HETIRDRAFT_408700 [Heterobasidion irregulare TC 32-1]|uniref:Uncharacterized protein n=1 Tax=Heterobasidion irregulare (strain TC 32-1) TaxID=747525 RepID=W4KIB5_HETIT|nr:uncharacterized protein HETIRDRAFT_408700 [Heterobasidion irregulare TC 32-1]ETW84781.1 hypothetical protein HETIRDRAFT_408700 [Heterobasidion irregulare TC 32-1]
MSPRRERKWAVKLSAWLLKPLPTCTGEAVVWRSKVWGLMTAAVLFTELQVKSVRRTSVHSRRAGVGGSLRRGAYTYFRCQSNNGRNMR